MVQVSVVPVGETPSPDQVYVRGSGRDGSVARLWFPGSSNGPVIPPENLCRPRGGYVGRTVQGDMQVVVVSRRRPMVGVEGVVGVRVTVLDLVVRRSVEWTDVVALTGPQDLAPGPTSR